MICIISATEEEICDFLKELEPQIIEEQPFKIFKKNNILLSICGIGISSASTCLSYVITKYEFDLIINIGVAGAVNKNIEIFDSILVKDSYFSTVDVTDFGYKYGQLPSKPQKYTTSKKYNEKINSLINFKILNCASSDIFINGLEQYNQFISKLNTTISIVDMELAAIMHTAFIFKKDVIAVKVISDSIFLESNKNQYLKMLKKCNLIISKNLFLILEKLKYHTK